VSEAKKETDARSIALYHLDCIIQTLKDYPKHHELLNDVERVAIQLQYHN